MAVTTILNNQQVGVKFDVRTDTSADFPSVANSKYIYNLGDKQAYYKDANGQVRSIFGERYTYEISFNEVLDVLQRFTVATNITVITAYNVATLKYSINGAADVTVTLPFAGTIALAANDRIQWKITYTTGTLAVINLTATEI